MNIHCEHIPYITLLPASIFLKIQIDGGVEEGREEESIRIHYGTYVRSTPPAPRLPPSPLYVCQEVSWVGGGGGGEGEGGGGGGQSAHDRADLGRADVNNNVI